MVIKSKLAALAPQVTSQGKELSFSEFLNEVSGSGELYQSYVGEMLDAAAEPAAEWHDVDDLIGPIAHHLVSESVEVEREIYFELVGALKAAWDKLRQHEEKEQAERDNDQEIIINENEHDVLHSVELLVRCLQMGCVIKDVTYNSPADMRIVIGKKDKEVDHAERG